MDILQVWMNLFKEGILLSCLIGERIVYLKENTKIPDDILEEKIDTEWFISAKEAVQYGMCEKIIESLDEVL